MTSANKVIFFNKAEEALIKSEYVANKAIIDAPLSRSVTKAMKDEIWKSIALKCSSLGNAHRSSLQVKKKFKNMKSSLKENKAKMNRSSKMTGGGSPVSEVRLTINLTYYY